MRAAGPVSWLGHRGVRIAAGVLVGTVLLLWVADLLARRSAEKLVAQALQEQTGTLEETVVTVRGPFFLPQVLRGRYDDVELSMEGVTSGPLRIASVDARLEDVYLSFHDLLHGDTDRLLVTGSEAEAFLSYDDLNRYLEMTGRPLSRHGPAGVSHRATPILAAYGSCWPTE